MVQVDMSQPDRVLKPGIDLWEILKAEHGKSKGNDACINLKLFRVSDRNDHLFDTIMLAGNGWPIGKKKLKAMIPEDFKGDLDLLMLVGLRLWVATEVQTYNGKDSLRVQIAGLKFNGLQKVGDIPPGYVMPTEAPLEGETPF